MRKIFLPMAFLALALSTAGAMAQTGGAERYQWRCRGKVGLRRHCADR